MKSRRKYRKLLTANGTCQCGCSAAIPEVHRRGPKRLYLAGHNPSLIPHPRKVVPPAERFWKFVQKTKHCWLWLGGKNRGYGEFEHERGRKAHRYAYELLRGPIPWDMTVDHLCKNKSCVNPAHMEIVSRGENTRRGVLGKRATHCKRGHVLEGNCYFRKSGKYTTRWCLSCKKLYDEERRRKRADWLGYANKFSKKRAD